MFYFICDFGRLQYWQGGLLFYCVGQIRSRCGEDQSNCNVVLWLRYLSLTPTVSTNYVSHHIKNVSNWKYGFKLFPSGLNVKVLLLDCWHCFIIHQSLLSCDLNCNGCIVTVVCCNVISLLLFVVVASVSTHISFDFPVLMHTLFNLCYNIDTSVLQCWYIIYCVICHHLSWLLHWATIRNIFLIFLMYFLSVWSPPELKLTFYEASTHTLQKSRYIHNKMNIICTCSDVQYEIFYILPIMIIAYKIYHDMIIIMYKV